MSKKKTNQNTKPFIEKISPIILILLILGFCGALILATNRMPFGEDDNLDMIIMIVAFIALGISAYLQIIIHEAGHLVFGLLSKYKFVSFRIGSLMLIKQKNKYKFKTLKLAGTGGQCLMSPPDLVDDKIPVILFNFGGSLMNLLVSVLFFILAYLTKSSPLLSLSLEIFAIVGLLYAFQNGIPMRSAEIDNDGLNALSLSKHPEAQKAFWIQLKINEAQSNGKRLKDMPEEWFNKPKEKDMKNTMIATIEVFNCNRLMDEHKFDETKKRINNLLKIKANIVGVHKSLLINDLVYCDLLDGKIDEAKKHLNVTQKNFMTLMKDFPSIIRTEYAISALIDKDKKKAAEIKKKFIARGKNYPYAADIKAEKELLDIITNICNN